MKIKSFSVSNYRSITNAHRIELSDISVLVGANNEGKSNIIRALSLAVGVIHSYNKTKGRRLYRMIPDTEYEYRRDFPLQLQNNVRGKHETSFRLEFVLDDSEVDDLRSSTGVNLGGELKIEVTVGKESTPRFNVILPGRGGRTLKEKKDEVCEFISRKIYFNHIPAVRTQEDAFGIVQRLITDEIRLLAQDDEYKRAMEVIIAKRQSALVDIADKLAESLKIFIPTVNKLTIEAEDVAHPSIGRRGIDIILDDGTETRLIMKGDGLKSLVALAILREKSATSNASIVAIEEPESHLHSAAIHQIRDVIYGLAEHSQVIISTHNPIFVDRAKISSNIIIKEGKASIAKNVQDVRECLGVQVSDNLHNTNFAIVVEGESDEKIIRRILEDKDDRFRRLIENGYVGFHRLNGAGKLRYHLSNLKNSVCDAFVILDNDVSAVTALNDAVSRGILRDRDYVIVKNRRYRESEVEDLIDTSVYKEVVENNYSVNLSIREFRSQKKWSDRMRDVFDQCGKEWNASKEKELKTLVATHCSTCETMPTNRHFSDIIDIICRSAIAMAGLE